MKTQASAASTVATALIAVPAGDHIDAVAERRTKPTERGGRRTRDPVPVVLTGDAAPMPRATKKEMAAARKKAAQVANVNTMTQAHMDAAKQPAPAEKVAAQVKQAPAIPTTGYQGPMRSLRDRLKAGAYTKMANGQPANGDEVAQALGSLEPVEVIKACMVAMDLPANPYAHLNVGQQSMNLRNKMRGQLKRGEIGMGVVREAVEVVMEARPAPAAPAPAALTPTTAPAPTPAPTSAPVASKSTKKAATPRKARAK